MPNSNIYSDFRYPSEIISHTVWFYFRFALSFRDVEEILVSRGIIVTYETIRQWTLKFGQTMPMTYAESRQNVVINGFWVWTTLS